MTEIWELASWAARSPLDFILCILAANGAIEVRRNGRSHVSGARSRGLETDLSQQLKKAPSGAYIEGSGNGGGRKRLEQLILDVSMVAEKDHDLFFLGGIYYDEYEIKQSPKDLELKFIPRGVFDKAHFASASIRTAFLLPLLRRFTREITSAFRTS